MMVSTPPHNLQLVIDFVNTLDVEEGVDRTETPAQLGGWLQAQGLRRGDEPAPGAAEHRQAIALREALREVMRSHTDAHDAVDAGRELEAVAERGELSVCFDPAGAIEIEPRADGYAGVLARLLVPVTFASLDGTWQRVKACDADDCQWAFYDSSRNRSGRWCDMAVCGNRTKVRAYRAKRLGLARGQLRGAAPTPREQR
jgi:predicted RNA-binding Zn ribbon-like protein